MEKLTVRLENGKAFCAVNCIGCSSVECDYIYKIIDKVAAYEDTGFTPEQVVERAKELERWHTDKINKNIKNEFANKSTLICHNCDHKDEYIEELEQELAEYKKLEEETGINAHKLYSCLMDYIANRENINPSDTAFSLFTKEEKGCIGTLIEQMAEEIENLYGRETELTQKARECLDTHWVKLKEMED